MRPILALAASLCSGALIGCGPEAADAPAASASLLERARVLREREDHAAAEAALTEALEAEEDATGEDAAAARAELYLERGITRERLDRPAEAEADYTAAVTSDPTLARAWNNRAAVRAGAGRLDEALADWDAALAADPGDELALANRALGRQEAGDFDGALEDAATWERRAAGDVRAGVPAGGRSYWSGATPPPPWRRWGRRPGGPTPPRRTPTGPRSPSPGGSRRRPCNRSVGRGRRWRRSRRRSAATPRLAATPRRPPAPAPPPPRWTPWNGSASRPPAIRRRRGSTCWWLARGSPRPP